MSDLEQPTELDLVVGSMITVRPDEDRAAYTEEYESVSAVQDQLRDEGIDVDLLGQPGTEVWEGGIENMGALYQLSRFAARLDRGDDIAEVIEDGPVLPRQPPRRFGLMTKSRSVSTGSRGPTIAFHQPSGAAACASPVSA